MTAADAKINWSDDETDEVTSNYTASTAPLSLKNSAVARFAARAAEKAAASALARIPHAGARKFATEAAVAIRKDIKKQAATRGDEEDFMQASAEVEVVHTKLESIRQQKAKLRAAMKELPRNQYTKLLVDVLDSWAYTHKETRQTLKDPLVLARIKLPFAEALVLALAEWKRGVPAAEKKSNAGRAMLAAMKEIEAQLTQ